MPEWSRAAAFGGDGTVMKRILIVEDNDLNRDVLSRRLAARGYEVLQAAEGQACLTLAETCNGAEIFTNGGLARDGVLHPLQRAFIDEFAAQCGFCTSGMIMAAKALLDRNPSPTREDVIDALSGNVCRCTGYEPIIRAVLTAARSNSQNAA